MPREGIDYPGWFNRAACSIRCELSKLWSAVGAKVAKLNTVEPDGDGKINIVSDSATLTVTDDQGNNAVRLELDPAVVTPPVQSVNGFTGTVVLNNAHIAGPYMLYNGSTISQSSGSVGAAIIQNANGAKAGDDALRTRMTAAETAISDEVSDRATADNALAAQIATKAGIGDTVVKNPVAAQSIAGYDLEVQENLDVDGDLTVGGTTDTAVATGTTGTYNTKAANSQRVKNELDAYSPMVRTTGNQTITGVKNFSVVESPDTYIALSAVCPSSNQSVRTNWYRVMSIPVYNNSWFEGRVYGQLNNPRLSTAKFYFNYQNQNSLTGGFIYNKANASGREVKMYVTTDGTNIDIWLLEAQYMNFKLFLERALSYLNLITVTPSAGDLATTSDPSAYSGVTASLNMTTLTDF